jgi:hypothetical protein
MMPVTDNKPAVLLSTAYLAPIQYYTKLLGFEHIYIEYFENYSKQSFRNRCTILSSNGPINIIIPVLKESTLKNLTKDIRIDNHCRWKQIHIRAIESAYRSSPFYLYYADDLMEVYKKDYTFLVDLNNDILQITLNLLNIKIDIQYTRAYKEIPAPFCDYSDSIHPKGRMKKPDNHFISKNYYQVFESRYGFTANLSIADLLFNMGPNSLEIIKDCIKI